MAIRRRMSAWGDIQSFGGKRLQDGEFAPIGSNRAGAQIRAGGRVASHDLWIPWDVRSRNCLVYRDSVLEGWDSLVGNRSSEESHRYTRFPRKFSSDFFPSLFLSSVLKYYQKFVRNRGSLIRRFIF